MEPRVARLAIFGSMLLAIQVLRADAVLASAVLHSANVVGEELVSWFAHCTNLCSVAAASGRRMRCGSVTVATRTLVFLTQDLDSAISLLRCRLRVETNVTRAAHFEPVLKTRLALCSMPMTTCTSIGDTLVALQMKCRIARLTPIVNTAGAIVDRHTMTTRACLQHTLLLFLPHDIARVTRLAKMTPIRGATGAINRNAITAQALFVPTPFVLVQKCITIAICANLLSVFDARHSHSCCTQFTRTRVGVTLQCQLIHMVSRTAPCADVSLMLRATRSAGFWRRAISAMTCVG